MHPSFKHTGPIPCPRCQSINTYTLNLAKKTGGTIGLIGGAASGIAGAATGARIGTVVGIVAAGPPGIVLGNIAGAILGGLIGAASGGLAGAKVGEIIDQKVLDNHKCADCGHTFSTPSDFTLTGLKDALRP